MAEALYRKYRPQVFEDVVGQEPIERTLKNAIAQDKVSHAYLLCGPRGTGKTTTARLLAKALLCQGGPTPDPDGTCEDCRLIADGVHPDVYELDAASRTGVENVREEIISRVSFAPTRGRSKVYIIDEVHMLSTAAFNALLKTLEEPPAHVVFVLCTTDPQKVPETIHSRCQRFDFRRIAPESMVSRLGAICIAENVEFEGEALDLIAHRAEGGLRNALTSLEQIIAFENGRVTLAGAERLLGSIDSNDMAEILACIGKRDVAGCFRWTAAYVETGADLAQFVRDMAEHVRNMYVMALVGDEADLDINETVRHELAGELQWFGADRLARLLGVLGDLAAELKTTSNPRLAFEIALTRMVRPDSDLTLEALAERIEALESGYSAVAHVVPGASAMPFAASAAAPAMAPVETSADAPVPASAAEAYPAPAAAAAPAAGPAPSHREAAPVSRAVPVEAQAAAVSSPAAAEAFAPAADPGPTAAPAAESIPATASAFENPASLQRIWQAALSAVKKQKQAYGVLFMGTKVRYDAAAKLVKVGFPAESTFAFNAVQKPDVQDALAAALAKAAGGQVAFAYERMGEQAPAASSVGSAAAPSAEPVPQGAEPARSAMPAAGSVTANAAVPAADPAVEPAAAPVTEDAAAPAASAADAASAGRPEEPPMAAQDGGVPYESVPYEDLPYDPVPYEDADSGQGLPDTSTSASPIEANLTPEGAIAENPADVEALLQAGFGGGVVFEEVDG